jgi:photosystem II stability/assembly factor-like uncharacterized protein
MRRWSLGPLLVVLAVAGAAAVSFSVFASAGHPSPAGASRSPAGTAPASPPAGSRASGGASTPAGRMPPAGPSPAAAPARAPVTFDSVSFVSDLLGWAAGGPGRSGGRLLVSRTADGGRSWTPGVAVTQRPPAPGQVAVRFASAQDGWVSALGLFSTADGGGHWTDEGLPGWVAPVAPAGTGAWALDYPCGPSQECRPVLYRATPAAGTWVPATVQPALPAGPAVLAHPTAAVAFAAGTGTGDAGAVLLKTADGGASWSALADPCPATLDQLLPASPDGVHVWLACGAPASDETQDKAVYVSADGGGTWSLAARSGRPHQGTLTGAGSLVQLSVASPASGVLVLAGYGLLRSADGGATWSTTSVSARSIPSGNDVLTAGFADPTHGWAATCCGGGAAFGSPGLFATTDGGATWSAVAVSP